MSKLGGRSDGQWELPAPITGEGRPRPLWAVDGKLTEAPVSGAHILPGKFSCPGLVDSHFHMALRYPGIALGMDEALQNLRAAREVGVLLVRDMGAPERLSLKLPPDPSLPRMISSGRQLAVAGGFKEGSHDPVAPEQLVSAALAEIAAGAQWVKVLTDWQPGDPLTYPIPLLSEMIAAVHAAGVRVAAHCSWYVHDVVLAGADSIEHGTLMDEETLRLMADRGVAWAPTTNTYVRNLGEIDSLLAADVPAERRQQLAEARRRVTGFLELSAAMVPRAAQLGVRLLASTDSCGSIADEVERWVSWGVAPETALGAATWDARTFLEADPMREGCSADVVTFDRDPRVDPAVLHQPVAILLRGRRLR